MSRTCKLTCFTGHALVEPIRYLLAHGNNQWEEDVKLHTDKNWNEGITEKMPFGKLPILEVNGKLLYQSTAICRYLARQQHLVGDNADEEFDIDAIVDTIGDLRTPLAGYFFEKDAATKAAKRGPVQTEVVPFYCGRLERMVEDHAGYLAARHLTWADLYLTALWPYLKQMSEVDLDKNYPKLSTLVSKVNGIPQIKAWMDNRSSTAEH